MFELDTVNNESLSRLSPVALFRRRQTHGETNRRTVGYLFVHLVDGWSPMARLILNFVLFVP